MDIKHQKLRVAIIVCYFGGLPVNYDLWLQSCGYNPGFDFFLITDQDVHAEYGNIHVIKASLEAVRRRISDALGQSVALDLPYKLCDYKPLYGIAFADLLSDYEFWGMCDVDMIFGDLAAIIRDEDLMRYDKIFRLGHLTLYRNCDWINWSFQRPGRINWTDVIHDNYHHRLCERGMMEKHESMPGLRTYAPFLYIDVSKVHRRYRRSNYLVPKGCKLNYRHQVFYWENGKVFRAAWINGKVCLDEFAYIHFQKRKLKPHTVRPDAPFYVTANTFLEKKCGVPSLYDIKQLNPYPGFFFELYEEMIYGSIKRRENAEKERIIALIEQKRTI